MGGIKKSEVRIFHSSGLLPCQRSITERLYASLESPFSKTSEIKKVA